MMLCPLNGSLILNRFVNVTCSFLISEESILKLNIVQYHSNYINKFFVDRQANQSYVRTCQRSIKIISIEKTFVLRTSA